jgi:hypothetical protein
VFQRILLLPSSEQVNGSGGGDIFFRNVCMYLGDCMSSLFIIFSFIVYRELLDPQCMQSSCICIKFCVQGVFYILSLGIAAIVEVLSPRNQKMNNIVRGIY